MSWNPLDKGAYILLTESNRKAQSLGGTGLVRGVKSRNYGKWYYEVKLELNDPQTALWQRSGIGVATADALINEFLGWNAFNNQYGWGYQVNAYSLSSYLNLSLTAVRNPSNNSLAYWAINDVIGVAVDLDSGKLWWSKNNVWLKYGGTGNPVGSPITDTYPAYQLIVGESYYPASAILSNSTNQATHTLFFGSFLSEDLTYTPPEGYIAWNDDVDEITPLFPAAMAINLTTTSHLQYSYRSLSDNILNLLLRSPRWIKPSSLSLALLTQIDPLTESSGNGYQRLTIATGDSTFTSLGNGVFANQNALQFTSCTTTAVGWAIFTDVCLDTPLIVRQFAEPLVLSSSEPGAYFPSGQLSFSIL